jgi:SAM-dependent methyltransferase
MSVLDVACGTGNAALPAARAGGRVTGIDLVPKLLEQGGTKAQAEGLEIEWVEGDAEELPSRTAPSTASSRPSGTCSRPAISESPTRRCASARKAAPSSPRPGPRKSLRGDFGRERPVHAPSSGVRLAARPLGKRGVHPADVRLAATGFELERHVNWIEDDSVESFADVFMSRFPPLVTAQAVLGERFAELRGQIVEIWREANVADDGTFRLPQEYLLAIVRL